MPDHAAACAATGYSGIISFEKASTSRKDAAQKTPLVAGTESARQNSPETTPEYDD